MPTIRRPLPVCPLVAVLWLALCALAAPATAHAGAFLPPRGTLYHGVSMGDVGGFDRQVGSHSPVVQQFVTFGDTTIEYAFEPAHANRSRVMLHISTSDGRGPERISPGAIAGGRGDDYLLFLNQRIAQEGAPVYVRLMAEMNAYWNRYSAFDANGRSRGAGHSTAAFRRAWRRIVLIVRGGPVAAIDARLRALGLPAVRTQATALPEAPVAFLWVPQVAGAPDTAANRPAAYWPGRAYVDWAGTDFYSKFPNFAGLERFYGGGPWRTKPFMFGEWAMWGADQPAFVTRLFRWVRAHRRTRMLMYNNGKFADGPFRITRYPRARAALARELRSPRFVRFTPEFGG